MTTTRPLTEAERASIAQRYGVTCDLDAVTVCPGATYSDDLALSEWQSKAATVARKRGVAKAKARR